MLYVKRVHIEKFIRGREYALIKGGEGKIDYLLDGEVEGSLLVTLKEGRATKARGGAKKTAKKVRARSASPAKIEFDLEEADWVGITEKCFLDLGADDGHPG